MIRVEINEAWCKGCNLCILFCPMQVLQEASYLNKRGIHPPEMVEDHSCNRCRMCELVCPDFAITVSEAAPQEVAN